MGLDFSPGLRRKLSQLRRGSDLVPAEDSSSPRPQPTPRVWVEADAVYSPGPWTQEETPAGSIAVRRLAVPLPEALQGLDVHRGIVYLDTETLGLGSQPVFLVGLAWVEGASAIVEHIYARDYAGEPALLAATLERWGASEKLVTFNGKSYDLPLLRDRMTRQRMRPPTDVPDEDLLYAARKRWKKDLPNCRLQTIEHAVLGRARQGDIPGRDIPDLYHRAVRTGEDRSLAPVFVHNAVDLLTLIEIHPLLNHEISSVSSRS